MIFVFGFGILAFVLFMKMAQNFTGSSDFGSLAGLLLIGGLFSVIIIGILCVLTPILIAVTPPLLLIFAIGYISMKIASGRAKSC